MVYRLLAGLLDLQGGTPDTEWSPSFMVSLSQSLCCAMVMGLAHVHFCGRARDNKRGWEGGSEANDWV